MVPTSEREVHLTISTKTVGLCVKASVKILQYQGWKWLPRTRQMLHSKARENGNYYSACTLGINSDDVLSHF